MPEVICPDCGKRLFHENADTLKIEENVHKKFCRKNKGKYQSYMHRGIADEDSIDSERQKDAKGKPILRR